MADGEEIKAYDDSDIRAAIGAKAPATHTHALSSISDVDATAKVNGNALIYDSATSKFKSQPLPAGTGSGATNLDGLSDVDTSTSTPADGDALVFGGGLWKPRKVVAGSSDIKKGNEILYEFDIHNFTVSDEQPTLYFPVEAYNANSTAVVHPNVLYFENPWNGYHFWMGINPYASINFENPAILVSHDGIEWFEPPGIKNPIDGAPPSGGYGSDINLFIDKDGKTMHALNRQVIEATGLRRLYIYSSTDGINWTTRHTILEGLNYEFDFMSPSILLEADGTYRMWTVDFFKQLAPHFIRDEIEIYTATDARGTWTRLKTIKMPKIRSDERVWHLEVKKLSNVYYMLYQTCHPTQHGGAGQLYIAKSIDGEKWEPCATPISALFDGYNNNAYKSTFLPVIDGNGVKLRVWYNYTGGASAWWVGHIELRNKPRIKYEYDIKGTKLIFKDTFDDPSLAQWTLQNQTPCIVAQNGIADTIGAPGTGKVYKVLPINDYIVNLTIEEITRETANFGAMLYINALPNNDWDGMMFGYEGKKLIFAIRKNATTIRKYYIRENLQKGDVISFEVNYTHKFIKVFINGTHKLTYDNLDNVMQPTQSRIGFFSASTGFTGRFAVQELSVYAIDYKEPTLLSAESQMKLLIGKGDDYKGDNFKKANGSVGTSLDGSAWTVGSGTFIIENNKLKSTVTSVGVLFSEIGWTDYTAEIATNTRGGVVLRYVDASNYIHVDYDGGSLRVRKTVGGVTTSLASLGISITGIRVVTATVANGRLKAFINGRVVYDDVISDSVFATSTKAGVYTNGVDLINYFLVSKM